MTGDDWVELTDAEDDRLWDRVYDELDFRPTTLHQEMPSFREPVGSITWRIDDIRSEEERAIVARAAASVLATGLMMAAFDDPYVVALDWQHASYRFRPAALVGRDDWLIPALPEGDYSLFLAHDLRFGWLAHPWEPSICVYGDLVAHVRMFFDQFEWRVLREDGRPKRHLRLL
jgi:Protein of unknown function (DUF2716)